MIKKIYLPHLIESNRRTELHAKEKHEPVSVESGLIND